MSFLIQGSAPASAHRTTQIINPALTGSQASGVIAYPTLENLLGQQDFCACDHCRSMLSPAASGRPPQFLDRDDGLDLVSDNVEVGSRRRAIRSPARKSLLSPQSCRAEVTRCRSCSPAARTSSTCLLPARTPTRRYLIDLVKDPGALCVTDHWSAIGHTTDGSLASELLLIPQFVADEAYACRAASRRRAVINRWRTCGVISTASERRCPK